MYTSCLLGITLFNALGILYGDSDTLAEGKSVLTKTTDKEEKTEYNEIQLEPKLFGFFPSIKFIRLESQGDMLTTSTTTQDPAVVRENMCKEFGGKIVNMTLCYEYVEGRERTHDYAEDYCSDKGGHLWVPNIYDPKLSFILFKDFPEVYGETYVSLWIGIERKDDSWVANTGQVFDDHPLLNPYLDYIYDYYFYHDFDPDCVVLSLYGNVFDVYPDDCSFYDRHFVCEYTV